MSDLILCVNTIIVIVHAHGCDIKFTFEYLITNCDHVTHMYSLSWNKIDDAGAQALVEGLQHCTNLQELE